MVGMGVFDESKHPRGQAHNAGQFRKKAGTAPEGELVEPQSSFDEFLARKREALLARGFVQATPGPATSGSPLTREGIDNWWTDVHARGEVSLNASYPQMPDDYTPGGHSGLSLAGHRRTYRRLYKSEEIALRMPSASAIRRFSKENPGTTFDVPISAEGRAGNPVSGHVRVTRTAPGKWSVTAINMRANAQERVAEAVNSILESRRPSFALDEVKLAGGLIEKARERRVASGVSLVEIEGSKWIRSAGYNDAAGEMVINLNGRQYGYTLPRSSYELVANAVSPGATYNALVKGKHDRHTVINCKSCGHWHREDVKHSCMTHRDRSPKPSAYNLRVRAFILGEDKAKV